MQTSGYEFEYLSSNSGLPLRGLAAQYVVARRTATTSNTNSKHTSFVDSDILFHHENRTYSDSLQKSALEV